MNQEIRRLNEAKAVSEAQLVAQRQETEAARATLQEAAKEIEAVGFEKKQLALQWRSSLIGIQKRDEAMQNVTAAIGQVEQRELEICIFMFFGRGKSGYVSTALPSPGRESTFPLRACTRI